MLTGVRLTAALLLSVVAVSGQTIQERGKRAIDATLAALGGDRYLAMQDRVESGRAYSFYREQLSGRSRATIYTRYLTRQNSAPPGALWVRERQSFGKEGRDGSLLFAEGAAYSITFRGARPLPKETLGRYQDTTLHNVFYILRQRLSEPGMVFEYQASDVIDNRPVDIVNITDADNRTVTVYLDQRTKLPARQLYVRRDPKTRDRTEEITIFSKYRDVGGGVQWPLDIQRLRNGEKIYEIYSESVEINKDLTDDLFTLPANMKMLKPAH